MKLNHVLLRVRDMQAMINFFQQAFGLETGYRPPFPFKGAWLYEDGQAIIHLAESDGADGSQQDYLGTSVSESGSGIVDHIALTGDDYDALIERLSEHAYQFFERTVPETREHQVFVLGPEGLKIEITFGQDKKPLSPA